MTEETITYKNSNLETVDIPRRGAAGSPRPADTVLVRDLGAHCAGKCQAMLRCGDSELVAEFAHHVGALKGLGVVDGQTSKRLDHLINGLSAANDKKSYFRSEIKPHLYRLRPAPRPKG